MKRDIGTLLGIGLIGGLLLLAVPVAAGGWRPAIETQTDAQWLAKLDSRLAPIHGIILGTLALVDSGSDNERDAYVVILQEQAAKGIGILDAAGSGPVCAADYLAVERTMLLLFGDSIDAYRQGQEGSQQAIAERGAMVPAAVFLLNVYGDRLRLGACVEALPQPTALPEPAAPSTATPMSTGG